MSLFGGGFADSGHELVVHALQDNLIMAGTALGVVLNSILLVQTLRTAHGDVQEEQGVLNPQPS